MRAQHNDSLKHWRALIAFVLASAILFASSAARGNAGQEHRRSSSADGTSRIHELVRVDQLKEVFQRDSAKVRLVVLVSPT